MLKRFFKPPLLTELIFHPPQAFPEGLAMTKGYTRGHLAVRCKNISSAAVSISWVRLFYTSQTGWETVDFGPPVAGGKGGVHFSNTYIKPALSRFSPNDESENDLDSAVSFGWARPLPITEECVRSLASTRRMRLTVYDGRQKVMQKLSKQKLKAAVQAFVDYYLEEMSDNNTIEMDKKHP